MDRRSFLRSSMYFTVVSATASLAACGSSDPDTSVPKDSFSFPLGVASGDPKDTSVVFWTRCLSAKGTEKSTTEVRVAITDIQSNPGQLNFRGKIYRQPGLSKARWKEILRSAEREARRPQDDRELFQVDAALLEHDREPEPALLVLQEKALAVPARQAAAQCGRLGDGEDRRMRIGPMRDPERIEAGEQLLGSERQRHDRRTMRPPGRQRKPCKAGLPG